MKNKKLLVSALLGVSTLAIGAVVGVAAGKKSGFRAYANPVEAEWHHYAERMPSINPGIKEYWVQCGGNYQFTAPASGTVVDQSGWDTSEFETYDERYNERCYQKLADSAVAGTAADNTVAAPSFGFTETQSKAFTANGYQGFDVDLSNYSYVSFAIRHDMTNGYLLLFGGNSAQSDNPEEAIAKNKNLCLWANAWYYFTLERNAEGKWDAYVGNNALPKRASASLLMDAATKSKENLNEILGFWTWDAGASDIIYSTAVYGSETVEAVNESQISDASIKEFYTTKQVRRVEQEDAWRPAGDKTVDEAGHADFYKVGGKDAIKLSAHYASSDDYHFNYNSGWSEWRFSHVTTGLTFVSFNYLYSDNNSDTANDGTESMVHTMCQWYGAAYQARNMELIPDHQWHTVTITGAAYDINYFVMKIYHFTGDLFISNIVYGSSTDAANITDASIKEFYTAKQVRRVEQEDAWRPAGDKTVDEAGHADFYKVGGKDAIRLSAHYPSSDNYHFNYNSGWSEWRFSHVTTGLSSVTFDYLYNDNNADTANDGTESMVHTMCQWYGAAYQARNMELIPDNQWHSITVTGASYDTNYFVMKIFHFTGDIFISNIVYA